MATFVCSGKPVHVYAMLSVDGLVKVGISGDVLARSSMEFLFDEKKEIVAICYSAEKIDQKAARICEAAILGFHRKYLVGSSEWLSARWETVTQTLNSIFGGKTNVIQINDEKRIGKADKYIISRTERNFKGGTPPPHISPETAHERRRAHQITYKEVRRMKNNNTETLRELLEKALTVYDTPDECVTLAITFIDGLKAGAAANANAAAKTETARQ